MSKKMIARGGRSYCECDTIDYQPRIGWFERLLMKVFPHFDITKEVDPVTLNGGFCPFCVLECNFCCAKKVKVLYLRRFYLWRSRWIGKNWGELYLHKIVRSDDDPDPHTHPWWFWTFLLKGRYRDEGWLWVRNRVRVQALDDTLVAPAFRRRGIEHIHRVRLDEDNPKPAWTLVRTGPYQYDSNADADWSFVTETGFVSWRKYLNIPDGEHGG
jgi:hypothetical protein